MLDIHPDNDKYAMAKIHDRSTSSAPLEKQEDGRSFQSNDGKQIAVVPSTITKLS